MKIKLPSLQTSCALLTDAYGCCIFGCTRVPNISQSTGTRISDEWSAPHPTNRDEDLADALYRSAEKAATSPSNGSYIDYAYSISLGFNKERYLIIMVVDVQNAQKRKCYSHLQGTCTLLVAS